MNKAFHQETSEYETQAIEERIYALAAEKMAKDAQKAVREYQAALAKRLRAEAASVRSGGNVYGSGDNPSDYRREGRADAYQEIADELEAEGS